VEGRLGKQPPTACIFINGHLIFLSSSFSKGVFLSRAEENHSMHEADVALFLQAYAMAQSNGNGAAFAKASAQSSTINNCFGSSLGFSQANAQVSKRKKPSMTS